MVIIWAKKKKSRGSGTSQYLFGSQFRLNLFFFVASVLAVGMFLYFDPAFTGLATFHVQENFSETVNLQFNESVNYEFYPLYSGELRGLQVSGRVIGNGTAKVYIGDYLVMDSRFFEEAESVEPDSVRVENDNITIEIGCEDCVKSKEEVVEVTMQAWFDLDVDHSKLCTRWEVFSNDMFTTRCHGSEDCCYFVGALSSDDMWNASYYAHHGRDNALLENVISAQVIYYDVDIENLTLDVASSAFASIGVEFYENVIYFNDICVESCNLDMNGSSHTLNVILENASLEIDTIRYDMMQERGNDAPILLQNVSDVSLYEGRNVSVDLNEYFFDVDDLSYSYYENEHIDITFFGSTAVIVPQPGFTGVVYTFFTANDSLSVTVSNVFMINVTEDVPLVVEETVETKERVVINEPVKWVKKVRLNKKDKISVDLPTDAYNVSVRAQGRLVSQVTVNQSGVVRGLEYYENEKRGLRAIKNVDKEKVRSRNLLTGNIVLETPKKNETTLIIEEKVSEVEVEYQTEGPVSSEEIIDDVRKRIVVSSDIHYEDILAYSYLETEVPLGSVRLYWLVDGQRKEVKIDEYDLDADDMIEYIEWIVPHLSNQTYELEIDILNLKSYPQVGDTWTVNFTTVGSGNLSISGVDGTEYGVDLEFISLTCDDSLVEYVYEYGSVFVKDYTCSGVGHHTVRVLTTGKHHQKFSFGDDVGYASNFAIAGGDFYYHHTSQSDFENGTFVNVTTNSSGVVFVPTYGETGVSNDMVLYLKFNNDSMENYQDGEYIANVSNGSVYTVHDYSNYGNNGTVFPNQTKWTQGKVGNALSFDGSDDYVDLGDVLDMGISDLTVSYWILANTTDMTTISKSRAGATNGRWWNSISVDGTIHAGFQASDSTTNLYSNNVVNDNNWHHIVTIWNRDSNLSIYIDGNLERNDSISYGDGESLDVSFTLKIGAYTDVDGVTPYGFFKGLIDEVQIYNRSLNATEINWSYMRGNAGLKSNVSRDGLVLYMPFDESSGDNAEDENVNAQWVDGQVGGGLDFDGKSEYIVVGNNTVLNNIFDNGGTITFWMYARSDGGGDQGNVIGQYPSKWYIDFLAEFGGQVRPRFVHHFDTSYKSSSVTDRVVDLNQWVHVAIVYDSGSTDNFAHIYINTNNQTITESGTPSGSRQDTKGIDVYVGSNLGTQYHHNGTIDELYVYNRTLNITEINWSYLRGSASLPSNVSTAGLVLYLPFNESSGYNATDSSGYANHGNLTNYPNTQNNGTLTNYDDLPVFNSTAKFNGALEFDGVDDYVDFNLNLSLLNESFTISVWVYARDFTNLDSLLSIVKGWESDGILIYSSWGSVVLRVTNTDSEDIEASGLGISSLPLNSWVNIVGVYDGKNISIYQDSTLLRNTTFSKTMFTDYDTGSIGARIWQDNPFNFFNGTIDQLIIWNRSLEEHEVRALYLQGVTERNHTYEWISPVLDSGEQSDVNWTTLNWGETSLEGSEISPSEPDIDLLMHFNNNCDDSSPYSYSCTSYGISYTSNSKFGSYASYFGNNNYAEVEID